MPGEHVGGGDEPAASAAAARRAQADQLDAAPPHRRPDGVLLRAGEGARHLHGPDHAPADLRHGRERTCRGRSPCRPAATAVAQSVASAPYIGYVGRQCPCPRDGFGVVLAAVALIGRSRLAGHCDGGISPFSFPEGATMGGVARGPSAGGRLRRTRPVAVGAWPSPGPFSASSRIILAVIGLPSAPTLSPR